MFWQFALLLGCLFQGEKAQGTDWSKIATQFKARTQGTDLADRIQAIQEMIATKDSRSFVQLAEAMRWAQQARPDLKQAADFAKREQISLRDQISKNKSERDNLVKQKNLSQRQSERLQELNQSINNLDKKLQEKKNALEGQKNELSVLDQMEFMSREGMATVLRDAPAALFENYRQGLAKALRFPGDLEQGVEYVAVLVKSGKKESLPFLEGILREAKGSEALFKATALGMTQLGGKNIVPSLIDFLGSQNSSVRTAAHEALKSATQQLIPLDKSAWQKWWNEKK